VVMCFRLRPSPGGGPAAGSSTVAQAEEEPRRRRRLSEEAVSECAPRRTPIALLRQRIRVRAPAGTTIAASRRVPTRETMPALRRDLRQNAEIQTDPPRGIPGFSK